MSNSRNLPLARRFPFDPEVWRFGLPPLVLALLCALWHFGWLCAFFLVVAFCMFAFFRDPPRRVPRIRGAALSPADGKVVAIETNLDPEKGPIGGPRICIFLSVLNAHVNRSPLPGVVERIVYKPGLFLNALNDASSDRNESNWIFMRCACHALTVRQISGLIARRIVCRVEPGQRVGAGERIGIIRFGSRTELYLPPASRVQVQLGQAVKAGETVMAYLPPPADENARDGETGGGDDRIS